MSLWVKPGSRRLFDHLVGASEEHRRQFEAKRFRSLEIDNQLEFGLLVKGDISRIGSLQNFVNEVGEAAISCREVNRIGYQLSLIHISEPTRRTPISYA